MTTILDYNAAITLIIVAKLIYKVDKLSVCYAWHLIVIYSVQPTKNVHAGEEKNIFAIFASDNVKIGKLAETELYTTHSFSCFCSVQNGGAVALCYEAGHLCCSWNNVIIVRSTCGLMMGQLY